MAIFDRTIIYNTIFFNVQSVTEYGNTEEFEKAEPEKFQIWLDMAKKRYVDQFEAIQHDDNTYRGIINELYLEKACFLPEFSKIVAISYGTLITGDDGKLKRNLKRIEGETEFDLIKEFSAMLTVAYDMNHQAKQPSHILCGHNVTSHDIPLLVKRIIKYRKELKEFGISDTHIIPQLLKKYLMGKPWDENIIDTVNVWKFNGTDYISMRLISEFMGLKQSTKLLPKEEINKLYWSGIEDDKGSVMEQINTQCANYTNLAIQLVNELRIL